MCNDGLMKRSLDSDKILLDNLEYDAAETTDVRRTNEDSNQMTKAADSAVQETRRAIIDKSGLGRAGLGPHKCLTVDTFCTTPSFEQKWDEDDDDR
uniref:Uncharacterized protein n=1 Tax=Vespula pensylvanica TaxID=30213 RepID=A0A834MW95_VESPE|nr:hypothetical protein H0235_018337 [Vespula pensylvanica]